MVRVRISKLGIFGILVEIGELFAKAKSVYLLQGKRYSSRKKREFYLSISILQDKDLSWSFIADKTHILCIPEWLQ